MTGRRSTDAAAFAVAAAGIALLAADQGGFFKRSWAPATIAFAAVTAIALLLLERLRSGPAAVALVTGLAALAAWTACSALWSAAPHATIDEAERTLVYVAAALALTTLAAAGRSTALLLGLVAASTGIAAYSLVERLVDGAHFSDTQGSLLERPLGYANALGALCAVGLVVAGLLAWTTRKPLLAAVAVVLVPALVLTQSRGSWIATAAGALVGAGALAGRRRAAGAAALVAACLAALSALPGFVTVGALQARSDYWRVAWHVIVRHPLAGTGAGTFDRAWIEVGDLVRWKLTLDAHSLYLETLAELGAVGLLVLLAALLPPFVAGVRAEAAAALGGATAFLVHAGLDWDWEMPAVTVAGLVCLAACSEPRAEVGKRTRAVALAAAVALALLGAAQVCRRLGLY
ncbi:MAG: O-antigen ligase family protein [Gaiellaceae bacterium]